MKKLSFNMFKEWEDNLYKNTMNDLYEEFYKTFKSKGTRNSEAVSIYHTQQSYPNSSFSVKNHRENSILSIARKLGKNQ